MREEFYKEYGVKPQPFFRVHVRRKREGAGVFALDFPRWTFPNKDGSKDGRRNGNRVQWGSCRLRIGRFLVACASPWHTLLLVEELRGKGVPIARCLEERDGYERFVRKRIGWESAFRAQSIYEWCFSQGKRDKKAAGDAFERFCAQLYERMGCKVHVTSSSNDEGRDIELVTPEGKTAIVECKCYAPDQSVGRELVQKLAGANRKCKADRMIFITTGKFLPTARQWVREIDDDFELVDGFRLARMVEEVRQKGRAPSLDEWKLSLEGIASYYPPDFPPGRAYPPVSTWASRDVFWRSFWLGIGLLGASLVSALAVMHFAPLSSAAISLRGIAPACLGALAPSSEYVLPDSDSRYYSREELEALSDWELYVGHNEIYARHGKGFLQDDLAEHFSQCSWYVRLYTPEEYDALPSLLNEYEQANSDLMWEVRGERGV
ncbi:restriction endonuclease [Gordonibacter sp. An230]|uniref:restriction endonuclease n=1 Tax=Gordonibacter sp. An230 TaxID=1965592 RepID=UPI0013A64219|nr:restriction endonuclease [Gordonibacter sp. An230]